MIEKKVVPFGTYAIGTAFFAKVVNSEKSADRKRIGTFSFIGRNSDESDESSSHKEKNKTVDGSSNV